MEDARDAEFVGVGGGGLGRGRRREVQAGTDTAVEREREGLAAGPGLVEVELQVPARVDVDVEGSLVDHHEALDRRIAHPRLRVAGDDHAGVEVRPAVLQGMCRRGDAPQVHLHGLPFVDRTMLDHDRSGRLLLPLPDAPGDVLREGVLVTPHQRREQLPRPVQAGQHRGVVSLDVLEEHRAGSGLEARRDRREFQVRIDLRAHPDQAAHRIEVLHDARKVAQPVSRHDAASVRSGGSVAGRRTRPAEPGVAEIAELRRGGRRRGRVSRRRRSRAFSRPRDPSHGARLYDRSRTFAPAQPHARHGPGSRPRPKCRPARAASLHQK